MLENEVVEWLGDQWPEDSSGNVAVELVAGDSVRGNGKGRRVEDLLRFLPHATGLLQPLTDALQGSPHTLHWSLL